jgi:predicted AAA+ superfamily ATPase
VRIPHGTVCVINGLVKTGKTAALTNVLPQLVLEHFPNALFCHLDFDRFMRPLSSAEDIAASLLLRLESWARHNGFTVSQRADKANGCEGTKANISELMQSFADSCRKSDRKIYFLIDEVHVSQDTLPSLFPVPSLTKY